MNYYHVTIKELIEARESLREVHKDNREFYLDFTLKTMNFTLSPYFNPPTALERTFDGDNVNFYSEDVSVKVPVSLTMLMQSSLNSIFITDYTISDEQMSKLYKLVDLNGTIEIEGGWAKDVSSSFYFDRTLELFIAISNKDGKNNINKFYFGNCQSDVVNKINEFLDKRCTAKEGVGTIHAMVKQGDYVETYPFDAIYKPIDMQLMYGEKFITFHSHLLNKLTNDTSGIALLHGLPGTGKSNYIKYLSSIVTKKKFIYVPATYINFLGSPEAIPFLSENTNCVFVLEDCEDYIHQRDGSGHSGVAEILNLADGLLSDLAKCQIICTFNAQVDSIDVAIKREGRLIGEHFFGKVKLDGEFTTLAEHFNKDDKAVVTDKPETKFGFV